MKVNPLKIVLAYSGGLDTSVMLKWLKETYECDVIAYAADVGQSEELDGLREKALATGAADVFVEDLKDEFVSDYVFTALKANAVYEGCYLLGTSLARPVIAKRQVEIARQVGADTVAHGATGKGNDQVRFELAFQALAPDLKILAPWREWEFKSRSDLIAYAEQRDIHISATREKPYSMDRNMMHISYEGGILEDPWLEPPHDMFLWTRSPEEAEAEPTWIEIEFRDGVPLALDGCLLQPAEMLTRVNEVGASHGIGRIDMVENRFVGIKSRGVYETPGMTILSIAHRAIESITLDREVMHLRDSLNTKIAELIYYGFWFSPEFKLIRSLIDNSQEGVTGTVRLKLYRGNCTVVGRKSPQSLYSEALATFEEDSIYEQADAGGFIQLNGLRLRVGKQVSESRGKVARQWKLVAS